jgi:hypothetical protein
MFLTFAPRKKLPSFAGFAKLGSFSQGWRLAKMVGPRKELRERKGKPTFSFSRSLRSKKTWATVSKL